MKLRIGFLWMALLLACGTTACQKSPDSLPKLGKIPNFELTDQNGQQFNAQQLKGKVWVGNFIFTSCGGACPILTQKMKGVERDIVELLDEKNRLTEARIVSFSVDPERDTPERLKDYMKTYGCDERLWTFLTGPLREVTAVVVNGFKISMGKVPIETPKPKEAEIFEIVHGEKFILVDRNGEIRGYYDADRAGLKKLIQDFKILIYETKGVG